MLTQQGPHALNSSDDLAHETQRLHELFDSNCRVVQFEKRYRPPAGGAPVWALVSVSLLRDGGQADGQPTCYLYQVHELTQQTAAAATLAALADERVLRQASELADAAKTDFLSRASHEMRTPLNAVIGFAQLLQLQKITEPAPTHEYPGHIRTAGEHLLSLVNDLLDLNRAGQGTLKWWNCRR